MLKEGGERNKTANSLNIDRIAFFGRTYAEYIDMFGLDESILRKGCILDCPAGASSFAAEAYQLGLDVTACDIWNIYDVWREKIAVDAWSPVRKEFL